MRVRVKDAVLVGSALAGGLTAASAGPLFFSCPADNDLFRVASANGQPCSRYDSPAQAIENAPDNAGVLILADAYPKTRTQLPHELLAQARQKHLRLYIEYPQSLPDLQFAEPRYVKCGPYGSVLERTVVASDFFGPDLPKMRILVINDCTVLPVQAANPHLVLARVVGYDEAVLGLPAETTPVLFEHPQGNILVATTKLSQFVTARYAPAVAWEPLWQAILSYLQPDAEKRQLKWTPTVRATYGPDDKLPADAERQTLRRAAEYYRLSRLLVHESGLDWNHEKNWIPEENKGLKPLPPDWVVGDGSHGILECYISKRVFLDGSQAANPCTRADCSLESAMGLAGAAAAFNKDYYARVASNLNDFIYFKANVSQGPRANPQSPSYGLLGHNILEGGGTDQYYGDDNARCVLSSMASAAWLKSDRWDQAMLKTILANFRTTGPEGFRPAKVTEGSLQANGWQHYWRYNGRHFSPHYQSYIWAAYLWLYDKTQFKPLLERARNGIRITMEAYPKGWGAECGRMDEERIHMLLPLAWLLRVEDTPQHRQWLDQMARYVFDSIQPCGAIPQHVEAPYTANKQYGTGEAPITYVAGDPATDLLYTLNFAISGMHEAAAVTGDPQYARAVDKMAEFFTRIQTRSETHPELDGTWFRSFDFDKWEYWGSDGDAGWGVWTNEIGWTHSWIAATLALRQMKTNLWDLTRDSKIAKDFDTLRQQMLPDNVLDPP